VVTNAGDEITVARLQAGLQNTTAAQFTGQIKMKLPEIIVKQK
jgi:hypothetical protein